jgi:hypothetical protein
VPLTAISPFSPAALVITFSLSFAPCSSTVIVVAAVDIPAMPVSGPGTEAGRRYEAEW